MNVHLMNAVERAEGRNEKMRLLRDADELTKKGIQYATDTFRTFGISVDPGSLGLNADSELAKGDAALFGEDVTPVRAQAINPTSWWKRGFALLDKLSARELTGNLARKSIVSWLVDSPGPDHTKWAVRVINQDLRCGVEQKTVVKLWPGLIEPFTVALAVPYEDQDLEPGFLEPKLDGLRLAIVDGVAYTRNGHAMQGVDHIVKALDDLGLLGDWVWDGECLDPNVTFEETSGTLRKHGGAALGQIFHPFDVIDRRDWARRTTPSLVDRKGDLRELAKLIPRGAPIKPIIGTWVEHPTMELLMRDRDRNLEAGLEGSMFKPGSRPYEFRRSDAIIKVKRFHTMDVEIVDVVEGNGKIAGMLGALVVEIQGTRFNVGSGFTEEQRRQLWAIRSELPGHIVEVKYQNKTAKGKGRFPTFVRLRPDKDRR